MIHVLRFDPAGMVIHHDQDSVNTSYAWTHRLVLQDYLQISFSLFGAKNNPEMEAILRRFKNENRSLLLDGPPIEMLAEIVDARLHYFNDARRHSALDNRSPG